jgi:ornithine cyclodeaminase/alanine dehydrogenase-like protein (mu-crystallin family)
LTSPAFIDAAQLTQLLPMAAAVDALEAAFSADELPEVPQRSHLSIRDADLLIMPAAGELGAGVKIVTVNPANSARGLPLIHGMYVLFAPGTLKTVGMIDGAAITGLRTAAVSGLATRWLARDDARTLVIYGAGTQGRAHLDAMRAVRPIEEVRVVSRTVGAAEELADAARASGLEAAVGGPDAVASADIVCTCTTSSTPVFDGSRVKEGTHINAVGAYRPDARELDDHVVSQARIVVETRDAALSEAGDLLLPIQAGVFGRDDVVADLSEVVSGAPVRRGPDDITVFKSVGVAFEDLVVARAAFDRLGA